MPFGQLRYDDGSPKERIVGFETEYGFGCTTKSRAYNAEAAVHLGRLVKRANGGEFLEDGDREYMDVGEHPELSTAEEISFIGAAHRLLRGHVKIVANYQRAEDTLNEQLGVKAVRINILAANTCDADGISWGSHENLLARRQLEPVEYIPGLAAHHLSRIVWSGSGKPRRDETGGYQFALSEKADHIWDIANSGTTMNRPLVNLRDRPYADETKYRRIHLVNGESIFSPFANALRLASGSIVLRACELGVDFSDLLPENPVAAIRAISHDPSLKAEVVLPLGQKMTGTQLQRTIAERAIKACSKVDYLTDEEKSMAEKWIQVCDDLDNDPQLCAKRVDWVVKQNLIERALEAKKGSGQSDLAVAWQKALDYHSLLPKEGAGMKLVRAGFFEDSPTNEQLENGLPLPETRARMRTKAVATFKDMPEYIEDVPVAHWEKLRSPQRINVISLGDPYMTSSSRLEAYLDRRVA